MTDPGPHSAFFYGTLMSPAVLHRVTGAPPKSSTSQPFYTTHGAILHAHRRRHVRNADYPAVTPAEANDSVRGTYVTGLRDSDLFRLDRFEGEEYARRKIRVRLLPVESTSLKPTEQQAKEDSATSRAHADTWADTQTYIWIAPESDLEAREWDFEDFVKTKLWRWSGDSPEFAESDAAAREEEESQDIDGTGGRRFFDGDKEEAMHFNGSIESQPDTPLSQKA